MPVVIAWIGEMLLTVVGQMAIRALIALGVGFAVHAGFSGVIGTSAIQSYLGAAGQLTPWIGFLCLDKVITIILSAWAGRMLADSLKVSLAKLPAPSSSSGGGAE